ncbi:membrane-bound O-acyltransferase family protein [Maribacter sp. 6B07]|uniref:MBOAT family O-acyltransferase n=1 Tax=Maribacter sp. 6B07 TaxID=2045442 RepID=UPI000C08404A|nr:MBOAT family O-acyltransferase [Maribacter sp. 6B07]PHN94575.1 membrane-bound O-acyltransferase family protein [Maribacter sp. 6B07]
MLFNSWEYLFFLPVVFVIYWALSKKKVLLQNILLLFASYTFYGFWDVRFLFLILASSLVDFYIGHKIYDNIQNPRKKKNWLTVSVVFNLGLLGTFKYFNFFVDSFIDLTQSIGIENSTYSTLNIILPVGISFYTFQTLSYSLDIYYQKLRPTKDLIAFTAFVSFFPQLVAGPIERASNLLSQIGNERKFNYIQITDGLKLILWGLFKKIVIADSLAPIVDDIFLNYNNYSASTLVLGIVFFSFQVYGDFSGYSDIAIGSSKLFGIELRSNFKFPHFSRNVAEYWQRWHISLSTWFRHYMYIPMGGSRVSKLLSIRNIVIIFLVSGFWHGANWTFIIWGGLHALFYIPVFLMGRNRIYADNSIGEKSGIPTIIEMLQVLLTFALVSFSRIFFRSPTVTDAFAYLKRIMTEVNFENYLHPKGYRMIDFFILIIAFTLYEYLIRNDERRPFKFKYKGARTMIYSLMILAMILFYDNTGRSFIYFQF